MIRTKKIVFIGLFSAMAFILMSTITIPIIPYAPYLRYDPSEIVSIFAAILFGPWVGVAVCFFKDLFYFLFRAVSIFGPTSDFLASSTFTFIVGIFYSKYKSKKSIIYGGIIGTIVRVIFMIPLNIVILNLQFGFSLEQVLDMVLPILIPFNGLKSLINFVGIYYIFSFLLSREYIKKLSFDNHHI